MLKKLLKKFNNSNFFVFEPVLISKDIIKYFEKTLIQDIDTILESQCSQG